MRVLSVLIVILVLCNCERVGSNPWMEVDYTEGSCGTRKAILTTTGCITTPLESATASIQTNRSSL